jgi:hypothetical protein
LLPLIFNERFVEWPARRSQGGAPIMVHDFAPADAEWVIVDASGHRARLRPGGNKVEKTVYLHALVEGLPITFTFRSTAYAFGVRFGADADRVRVTVDCETVRVGGALYCLSSGPERNDRGETWWGPRIDKRIGVLGEPDGPSLELVRRAKALRFEFKLEEQRRKQERLSAIPVIAPTATLISPPRGTTTFTSGVSRWSDPPALDAKPVDPDDSGLPWMAP